MFFFISFFYSCLPAPESSGVKTEILSFELIKEDNKKNIEEYNKKTIKEDDNNICFVDEASRLNQIKEGEVWELFVGGYVTWAKSGNLKVLGVSKDLIILNDREEGLMGISEEEKYENYKHALKKSMVNDIENKIKIMEILYNIKSKKLYRIDGHVSFKSFIEEFLIARTQAYLYLKIYEQVLKGNLSIKEIRDKGMIEIYRNIKSKEVVDKKSIQNSIKPLRFQLQRKDSYDFYKSNAKFTGYLLDKIFSSDKDYLNQIFKEYSDLNLKKTNQSI